jgi:hypothetical protein
MILVPLLNPKFANVSAEKSCELRVRGTRSRSAWALLGDATHISGLHGEDDLAVIVALPPVESWKSFDRWPGR